MKPHGNFSIKLVACLFLIGIWSVWGSSPVWAAAGDAQQGDHKLLSVGKAGAEAIDLQVWTQKTEDEKAQQGIPAEVRVKASKKACLTSIYIAPNGDAIILLPSSDLEESVLLPNKEYTLFGPGSRIKLKESDTAKNARIVFFVSSAPLNTDNLKPAAGDSFVRIPLSALEDMRILMERLEALSKDPRFNCKVLTLKNGDKKGSPLDLMGLPTDVKTAKPMGVTGVQGLKSKLLDSGKE